MTRRPPKPRVTKAADAAPTDKPFSMVFRTRYRLLTGLMIVCCASTSVHAQDLVPGAYSPVPIGVNVFNVTAVLNDGALAFDPSLPIAEASATIGGAGVGIVRTLSIAGRYANVGIGIPFVLGHLEGLVLDQFQEASRTGFGDMAIRAAVNLYGAPAMTRQEFAKYRASTVIGVSVIVGAPVGQYLSARPVNLGTNRWSFRPELGFMHTTGRWTFEGDLAGLWFTDNTDYVNGATREQAPIVALQGHLIYTFRPGLWIAGDSNYWKGGRITTDGTAGGLEQKNSRLGVTLATPIKRQQWRFSYSFGAYTTIGGDYHSLGVSYTYVWVGRSRP